MQLTDEQSAKVAQCLAYGHQFFTWGRGHKRIDHKKCTYCGLTLEQSWEFERDEEPIAEGDYRYYDPRQQVID